jgi:VWFA-related protein
MGRVPSTGNRPGPESSWWLLSIILAAGAVLTPGTLYAQTAPKETPKETTAEISSRDVAPTFKLQVERNLVVVRVVVRNTNGATVDNLRKEDFQLFDRGKIQTISHFSLEKTALKPAPPPPGNPPAKQPEAEAEETDEAAISPSAARRFLAVYFDDVSTEIQDIMRTREAAAHYLAKSLQAGDRVGLFTSSGQGDVDFTDDVAKVQKALDLIQHRPVVGKDTSCGAIPPYEAFLIFVQQDPIALAVATDEVLNCQFNDDPTYTAQAQSEAQANAGSALNMAETESRAALRGIEMLVRAMSALPGQRSLVVVSDGFLTETLHYELDQIIDRALRSNVIINALDARGLYTDATTSDASQGSFVNTRSASVAGNKHMMLINSAILQTDGIRGLALDTGGVFFNNSNDLETGFERAAALPNAYYVLTFSPQNLKLDGSFHALKVKLVTQTNLNLQARRGYYAPKKPNDPTVQEKEEIEEAVFSQDEMRELPLEVHTQFFMKTETDAQLAVLTRLDLHQVHFRKAEDRNLDNLTFVTAVFDRDGHLVSGQQKLLLLRLRDESLARFMQSGISVKLNFDVKPGTYLVRAVVRDSEGGQISGINRTVEIPY